MIFDHSFFICILLKIKYNIFKEAYMRLYNTLTRKVEEFIPNEDGI